MRHLLLAMAFLAVAAGFACLFFGTPKPAKKSLLVALPSDSLTVRVIIK